MENVIKKLECGCKLILSDNFDLHFCLEHFNQHKLLNYPSSRDKRLEFLSKQKE